MRKRKKINIMIVVGVGAVLIFVAVMVYLNRSIDRRLKFQTRENADRTVVIPQVTNLEPAKLEEPRPLVASDLSGYQIVPQRLNRFTNNQRYWDTMTKGILKGSDTIEGMERGGIFKGTTMSPSQFQKQLQRIDGRIETYEQIVIREPGNGYAQKKLNDLYMLKSSMDALRPAIVAKE